MKYRNTRPGSPKGRVYSAFTNIGSDAAKSVAAELGVANKLDRWIQQWTETAVPTTAVAAPSGRVRYYIRGDDEQEECILVQAGAEQSVIRFVKDGLEVCMSNTYLVEKK